MKDKGIGTTADILALALLVSISCTILIGAPSLKTDSINSNYASKVAQNTLLALQNLPARKIGDFSYTPDLPTSNPKRRNLKHKTVTQLISEDFLLNPQWEVQGRLLRLGTNRDYGRELDEFLRKTLEKFVGRRFGFRLTISSKRVMISKERSISYQRYIGKFNKNSKKICSETLKLDLTLPQSWLEDKKRSGKYPGQDLEEDLSEPLGPKFLRPDPKKLLDPYLHQIGGTVTLNITLELWSR